MYKIYKLTLKNKCYIGITKQEKLYNRCQYGSGYEKNKKFYDDICKFGWNEVRQEILEEVETKEEALEKEREYILKFESNNPDKGYNSHINNTKKKKSYIRNRATNELFPSLKAAAEAYGVTHNAIHVAIKKGTYCCNMKWDRVEI